MFSLGKISVAQMFNDGDLILREESLRTSDIEGCSLIAREIETIERGIDGLEEFLAIKQFDDKMEDRLEMTCGVPQVTQARECLCECHKVEKLAIYGVFTALKMIDQFDIQRFGDIYLWYYYDQIDITIYDVYNYPYGNYPHEVIDFDKAILTDLRYKELILYRF